MQKQGRAKLVTFSPSPRVLQSPPRAISNWFLHTFWNNTVLAKGELVTEINTLKNQAGDNMIAYGGSEFVSDLIKHRLVDELYLFINPVSLGKG